MRNLIAILLLLIASPAVADCVVFLHSEHCPPCKAMEPIVWKVAEFNRIIWVDIDERPDIAREYRVTRIPCFVAVAEYDWGNVESGRITGVCTAGQLRALCANPIAATISANVRNGVRALFFCPPEVAAW
jgi:thiol-disulfide isomerase/thioredoxin